MTNKEKRFSVNHCFKGSWKNGRFFPYLLTMHCHFSIREEESSNMARSSEEHLHHSFLAWQREIVHFQRKGQGQRDTTGPENINVSWNSSSNIYTLIHHSLLAGKGALSVKDNDEMKVMFVFKHIDRRPFCNKDSYRFELNLTITKWILVYVLEH